MRIRRNFKILRTRILSLLAFHFSSILYYSLASRTVLKDKGKISNGLIIEDIKKEMYIYYINFKQQFNTGRTFMKLLV